MGVMKSITPTIALLILVMITLVTAILAGNYLIRTAKAVSEKRDALVMVRFLVATKACSDTDCPNKACLGEEHRCGYFIVRIKNLSSVPIASIYCCNIYDSSGKNLNDHCWSDPCYPNLKNIRPGEEKEDKSWDCCMDYGEVKPGVPYMFRLIIKFADGIEMEKWLRVIPEPL